MAKKEYREKKILFRTGGGLGKNIIATAVAKAIKAEYPNCILHVQSSYPRAFAHLPYVDEFYPAKPLPYFRQSHIDFEIFDAEPYLHLGYRQGKTHLIDAWCEMLGVKPPAEKHGEIVLNSHEKKLGDLLMKKPPEQKIIAFQPFGGTSYYTAQDAQDPTKIKHYRDLEPAQAQAIVNGLRQRGYIVLQASLPTEPQLENAIPLGKILNSSQISDPRHVFAILSHCDGLLGIDSFAVHAWHALGKDNAVVLWGGTSCDVLGYPKDKNMAHKDCKCPDLHCHRPDAALGDYAGDEILWTCPLAGACMAFDAEKVVGAVCDQYPIKQAIPAPAPEPDKK